MVCVEKNSFHISIRFFGLCVGTGEWQKIGTVLGIAELGTTLATTTLGLLSNVERKIVISLGNLEGVDWTGL